jgi:hypothetical protein
VKLPELQHAYRDYLLTGESACLAPAIIADAFDGTERLGIYRSNFLIGLGEALKANFPVTLQLLGREFFEQAARRFVLAHPPRQPCLFEYGADFPDYLRALPQLSALPYVAEMARFEFARIASYNGPTETYLGVEMLAGLPPERLAALPVRRARHAQIVIGNAPVLALWTAHQAAEPDLAGIDMAPRPHALLVCRPERTLVIQELEGPATRFLSALQNEASLGHAAAESGAEDDAALGRIISMALTLRLLAVDMD